VEDRRRKLQQRLVGAAILAPTCIALLDKLFTRTDLITPIDAVGHFIAVAAGTVAAAAGAIFLFRQTPKPRDARLYLAMIGMPLAGAMTANYLSYRFVELGTFAARDYPITTQPYALTDVGVWRGRHYARIDPFGTGGWIELQLAADQYHALTEIRRTDYLGWYCITVSQQKSPEGAVRIYHPAKFEAAPIWLIRRCIAF
jgi:hypothetical protein